MNKVRILLFTIAILGTVGFVFAVKATKRNTAFCTTLMKNSACPGDSCGKITTFVIRVIGGPNNICLTPFLGHDCKQICPVPANTIAEF
jgi:hypothetical protein